MEYQNKNLSYAPSSLGKVCCLMRLLFHLFLKWEVEYRDNGALNATSSLLTHLLASLMPSIQVSVTD